MRRLIYDPSIPGTRMTIVCFVSGSGTNYEHIAARDPNHDYIVFTNRPGCGGTGIARKNGHEVIELSHSPYLSAARSRCGSGGLARNCPERVGYEQDAVRLIEQRAGREPDLICLAGYDQWITDWMVDRYYPRILNVHPGDTTRGYDGLHWIPLAKAVLAGDESLRSTLFLVDKGEDTGPVLVQSSPVDIAHTLARLESAGTAGLLEGLRRTAGFARSRGITTCEEFERAAGAAEKETLKQVCESLQGALKVEGDWEIYPFAVHDLIGRGRVEVEDRTIYIDGRRMQPYGYRMDERGR